MYAALLRALWDIYKTKYNKYFDTKKYIETISKRLLLETQYGLQALQALWIYVQQHKPNYKITL